MITIFFSFMSLGIFFWYMNIYMDTIRGDSLMQVGVQYLPLTIVGCANAFFAAWLVPRVPAQVIIGVGCLAMVITYQRPSSHHSRKFDLLGDGVSRYVCVSFHDRFDHH